MTVVGNAISQVANGLQAATLNGSGKKPHLLFCSSPIPGHLTPLLNIAGELVKRGWTADFITSDDFREKVEGLGANLYPIPAVLTPEVMKVRDEVPGGVQRFSWDMTHIFVGSTECRWEILMDVLAKMRKDDPSREVILVTEPFFMGANPMLFGAPLPEGWTERPKVVNLGISSFLVYSVDVGPAGLGLPPDSSKSGRRRNQMLETLWHLGPFAEPLAAEAKVMKKLGATTYSSSSLTSMWFRAPDMTLQLAPPSMDYVRSDLPDNCKYVGWPVLKKPAPKASSLPSWWGDITRGDRKVVMVSQGTIALDYTDLIVPTLQGLADRDDVYVVVVLGVQGASLPSDVDVPANARIIDYIAYDALLAHSDVFVMNAGYGGVLHGMMNGVPMVLAGSTEDKPDVAVRADWAGIAINLATGQPSASEVRDAVGKILGDDSFRKRVAEVKKENEDLDALGGIEKYIMAHSS